ncbi:Uncharacterized conserved protein encoded by sequence overlapping the COX4 gene [Phaffia rhodozyma]|uniref:Uncharacterized conserved protein encoded by sequence overlapping the COX4 protein n=1 Tax=Phaffia rhodozyma TaxID=264483 RepID=A0A0F7SVU6_PHARH|nr:Uncharacterized conserved protein encoded by sequence overlapping the COX4 gene [Phaffia rhodozyma]
MFNTYQLAHLAYLKIVLHAAKYPSSLVNGVLLGSASGSEVNITDSVPLLHHWTSLSPSMEVGLEMAEYHASSKGLRIVGFYQGNERLQDGELSTVGVKVANSIKSRFPQAVVLMIDNEKLNGSENTLKALVSASNSTWSVTGSPEILILQRPTSPSDAKKAVQEGAFKTFGDFDAHLEDVTVDWLTNSKAITGWA